MLAILLRMYKVQLFKVALRVSFTENKLQTLIIDIKIGLVSLVLIE